MGKGARAMKGGGMFFLADDCKFCYDFSDGHGASLILALKKEVESMLAQNCCTFRFRDYCKIPVCRI